VQTVIQYSAPTIDHRYAVNIHHVRQTIFVIKFVNNNLCLIAVCFHRVQMMKQMYVVLVIAIRAQHQCQLVVEIIRLHDVSVHSNQ